MPMLSVLNGPWLLVSVLWFGIGIELVERLAPAGVEDAQQQFVLLRVVAVGLRERDAVLGMVGQAHAEAVGLHAACRPAPYSPGGAVLMRGSTPLFGSPGTT